MAAHRIAVSSSPSAVRGKRRGRPSRKKAASYLPASAPRCSIKPHLEPGNELNLSICVPALALLLCIMDSQVCLC